MKKQETTKQLYDIDDFPCQCHLWNVFGGGSGKGLVFLRKIVDAIYNNTMPIRRMPSILIVGDGKSLLSRATVNSLLITDFRVSKAVYFDNGFSSYQIFKDSQFHTAHIVEEIEQLKQPQESTLWKYIEQGSCLYPKCGSLANDVILHCNGLILLTAKDIKSASKHIVNSVDYVVELEPYTREQFLLIAHQYLKFCCIEYDGEEVLQEIVGINSKGIRVVMKTLKTCIVLLRGELVDCLTVEIVKKAKRLCGSLVNGDDIPF